MHSIICFGTFLLLANIICFFWFNYIGLDTYFDTFIGVIIVSIITFLVFLSICNGLQDDVMSEKEKSIKCFSLSVITLFVVLLLINTFYYIACANGGAGAGIVMIAVIPVTIFMLLLYLLYAGFYFGVLEIVKGIKEFCESNSNKKEVSDKDEIEWWHDLILMLICWGIPYYSVLCSCFNLNIDMNSSITLIISLLLIIWLICISFRLTSKVKDNQYMKIKKYPEAIIAIMFVMLLVYKYLKSIYIL